MRRCRRWPRCTHAPLPASAPAAQSLPAFALPNPAPLDVHQPAHFLHLFLSRSSHRRGVCSPPRQQQSAASSTRPHNVSHMPLTSLHGYREATNRRCCFQRACPRGAGMPPTLFPSLLLPPAALLPRRHLPPTLHVAATAMQRRQGRRISQQFERGKQGDVVQGWWVGVASQGAGGWVQTERAQGWQWVTRRACGQRGRGMKGRGEHVVNKGRGCCKELFASATASSSGSWQFGQ